MERITTDIAIAGGGIAGLTATIAMATAGFKVTCIDPMNLDSPTTSSTDLRSTAFWEPAVALLHEIGLWARLSDHATPLSVMRIVDAGGPDNVVREEVVFKATDLDRAVFGYNLPNWVLRREMLAHLDTLPNAELISGTKVVRATPRSNAMLLQLSDGRQLSSKLAIAADGRDSFLREAAGIKARRWGYGQKALVLSVSHTLAHQNASIEIHRSGGPFTLVPLPDQNGVHHSSIVWMETGPNAAKLHALNDQDFAEALNQRSCNVLGELTPVTPRAIWPIISQVSAKLNGPRLALIAEAAHVVPPIGAQGLNMSLGDIRALRDLCVKAQDDPGTISMLDRYHRARHPDMSNRILGIDLLNRAAMAGSPVMRDIRRIALKTLDQTKPLRNATMRAGIGA